MPTSTSPEIENSQQSSEERYRELFLQEQTRARHLSLINEVQKCALATRDTKVFLQQVTRAIHSHFSGCDVSFYLCEQSEFTFNSKPAEQGGDMVLMAQAGSHDQSLEAENRCQLDSLPGRTVELRRTLYFDEIEHEENDGDGPENGSASAATRSAMCVPVIASGHVLGSICMQSETDDDVEGRDAVALQTAAGIIAAHLESGRLFEEMHDLSEFNSTLISSMLHSLMAADPDGNITMVNARLCKNLGLSGEELVGQPLQRIFGQSDTATILQDAISKVTAEGEPLEIPEVQIHTPEGMQVFDVRLFRVHLRGKAQAVLLLLNITSRWRMFRQLQLMNEIGRLFQASLDINKVLHTVLTCVTAGAGLGFNRAFLLLREDSVDGGSTLRGEMALGPSSAEEAAQVWSEMGIQDLSLPEIMEHSQPIDHDRPTLLEEKTLQLEVNFADHCSPALGRAMEERRALAFERADLLDMSQPPRDEAQRRQRELVAALFTAPQMAIVPLLAKDRIIGIIAVDNLYSGAAIEPDDVQLLDALALQAGRTIANALAYQAMHTAQRELLSAERLAAVGEMAARVSHEIRNPLATVGGFARSLLKSPENHDAVERKAGIIVEEVERLEELLSDHLDMSRPQELHIELQNLNSIVDNGVLLTSADIKAMKVRVEKHYDDALPPVPVDRARVLQAVLNIARNGAQSMPEGGVLTVSTRLSEDGKYAQVEVRDEGIGISGTAYKHIFDPFFSTKLKGSGLGLAITRRIVEDHQGEIDVYPTPEGGTTFVMNFPMHPKTEGETENGD